MSRTEGLPPGRGQGGGRKPSPKPPGLGARGRGPQAPSPVCAPNQLFELLRCSGRLIELKLKRSTSRFAPLTLRCRTGMLFQNIPVFRSAYFPIPHRPTFGAPVFRSAYSASRNARASAAFAASIEAHCAVCRETLMLQVRCARPAPSHRNDPLGRSGVTVGLFSAKSTQYSLLQNARPSGSLREPYG